MSYYTQRFPDLKTALQATMVYSPDLTAAVAAVQTAMAANWTALSPAAWQTDFLARFVPYTLLTAGTQFWGIESDQNTLRLTKTDQVFVTFEYLSDTQVEARILTLNLAGWTYHS